MTYPEIDVKTATKMVEIYSLTYNYTSIELLCYDVGGSHLFNHGAHLCGQT